MVISERKFELGLVKCVCSWLVCVWCLVGCLCGFWIDRLVVIISILFV